MTLPTLRLVIRGRHHHCQRDRLQALSPPQWREYPTQLSPHVVATPLPLAGQIRCRFRVLWQLDLARENGGMIRKHRPKCGDPERFCCTGGGIPSRRARRGSASVEEPASSSSLFASRISPFSL